MLGVTGILEDAIMRVKFLAIALDDPKADMIDGTGTQFRASALLRLSRYC